MITPNSLDAGRLNILMLVPHEPSLDPRIHYMAAGLAKRHNVTVVAATRSRDIRPNQIAAGTDEYKVVRLSYRLWPRPALLWQALALPRQANDRSPSATAPAAAAPQAFRLPLWRRLRTNLAYLLQTLAVNDTLQRHLRKAHTTPDLIFCHDLYTMQTGAALKRATGAKLVYDSHEYYPMQFTHRSFVTTTLWYERKLAPYADLHLTISPQLANELEAVLGVKKIHALPNAEPRPEGPVTPLGTEMADLAKGRVKFLYQGNFVEGRGLEELLSEWCQVDHKRAALFFRGPENPVKQRLRDEAKRLALLDRAAYFLPSVIESDLIAAAAEADVGIIPYKGDLPSYRFACPNKLSQYMHAGLAILANDISFVANMVRANSIGWVYDVDRSGSLAKAVADALQPAELEERRKSARITAHDSYCWEVYEDRLLDLIDTLAPRR